MRLKGEARRSWIGREREREREKWMNKKWFWGSKMIFDLTQLMLVFLERVIFLFLLISFRMGRRVGVLEYNPREERCILKIVYTYLLILKVLLLLIHRNIYIYIYIYIYCTGHDFHLLANSWSLDILEEESTLQRNANLVMEKVFTIKRNWMTKYNTLELFFFGYIVRNYFPSKEIKRPNSKLYIFLYIYYKWDKE